MVEAFKPVDVEFQHISYRLPQILADLYQFINDDITEGLFRINGSLKKVNYYYANMAKYNRWLPEASVYDVCSLLKKLLISNYKFVDVSKLDLSELRLTTEEEFNWEYFNKFINNNINTLNLNIFLYTMHFLSEMLKFNEVTKMSLLNYSIIFQPIFFPCDNLIGLPNYINLLNFLLEHKDNIVIDTSLIDSEFKLALEEQNHANEFTDNSSIFYKFKNFKNKSIDSINDIGRRFPLETFKGYRMNGKSYETLPEVLEHSEPKKHDIQDITHELTKDIESSEKSEASEKSAESYQLSHNGEYADESETELQIDINAPDIASAVDLGLSDGELEPETKPFLGLDPSASASYKLHSFTFSSDIDQSIDPLTVDPEVNEVVNLKDIDTTSFQFNIKLDKSSASLNSLNDSDSQNHTDKSEASNTSRVTNDTSFQVSDLSHKNSSYSVASTQNTGAPLDNSKNVRKLSSNSSITTKKRSSTILSRIESRITNSDRLVVDKRKSFIKLFKNEGTKFPLKLKSKSVY